MEPPSVRDALRGRCVLIAHEDAFRAHYLADVIRESGAIVIVMGEDMAAAVERLDAAPHPDALVVSRAMSGDPQMLVTAARARGAVTLVVGSSRTALSPLHDASGTLIGPHAGFQVVEVLADLLRHRPPVPHDPAGPQLRGH